jgi:hypothetical protein
VNWEQLTIIHFQQWEQSYGTNDLHYLWSQNLCIILHNNEIKKLKLIHFQIVTHVWELRQCSQDSDYCYRLKNLAFKSQQEQEMFLFSMCGLALGPI